MVQKTLTLRFKKKSRIPLKWLQLIGLNGIHKAQSARKLHHYWVLLQTTQLNPWDSAFYEKSFSLLSYFFLSTADWFRRYTKTKNKWKKVAILCYTRCCFMNLSSVSYWIAKSAGFECPFGNFYHWNKSHMFAKKKWELLFYFSIIFVMFKHFLIKINQIYKINGE